MLASRGKRESLSIEEEEGERAPSHTVVVCAMKST